MKNEPKRFITMEVLAREAGVSQATVSLALRNDPRVSKVTRARIQELAEKMGYRPDPAMSALVAYRSSLRTPADYGTLAILHDSERPENRLPPTLIQHVEGMKAQAEKLGYRVELFRVRPEEQHAMKLSRILYSRGIPGLLLTSLRMPSVKMQWEHFSSIVLGEYLSEPKLNHVKNHHAEVLTTTYTELRKLGYRKIGFTNLHVSEERKHFSYLATYLKCLYLDGIDPASSPPFFYEEDDRWTPVPWLKRHKFDAVMSLVPQLLLERLQGTPFAVPETLGVAGYSTPAEGPNSHIAGCVVDYRRMGMVAVNLLQSMIHRGQRGVSTENEHLDVLVRGEWRSGSTVRQLR